MLVDTHAHLDDPVFERDLNDVIARACRAGVGRIVAVGTDLASSRRAVEIARHYPEVAAAAGLHPTRADQFEDEAGALEVLIGAGEICAVGEIGLDYARGGDHGLQGEVFRNQLAWARALGLPVIVHDRDAHEDVMEDLRDAGSKVVLHCFSGSPEMSAEAAARGMFVSLAGNVTFPKATGLREVARTVPLDRLLVETDSPYLSPRAWRGRRNEPAHVAAVAETVAGARRCTLEEIAAATSANAAALFGWA